MANRPPEPFLRRLVNTLRGWFAPRPQELGPAPVAPQTSLTRRLSVLVIDPILPNKRRLSRQLRWNDSDALINALMIDLREVSHGWADYAIAERLDLDEFPIKQDGFRYTAEDYLRRWETRAPFHMPDDVNYSAILERFDLIGKVNRGEIDEVWAICFPWGGFYESRMAGPGAFFCNAPPHTTLRPTSRRFVIMCYNYERGVGEMLESYGHRAESILAEQFRRVPEPRNLWRRYTLYDAIAPGRAEVGNIHFAPNSTRDYEWGSMRPVPSRCRSWERFPDLSGDPVTVDAREWGGGDIRLHHRWWFNLLPHVPGETDGIANNWWQYIVDPNLVRP